MRSTVIVCVLVACGGARTPTGPQPDLDKLEMYEPFAARTEAKRPDQAIIHGTDAKGNSTVMKLPNESREAIADAMGVRVKLVTAPNSDGTVRVGVFEEKVGGSEQWRAGVWVAALVAAHTLNKDLTDFTFSASSSGDIDGPSASGLITAGFLATMTGAAIDPTATIAGTINPDGTIGPVAGLAEKVKAALATGKTKKLGYPSGMRVVHVDDKTVVDIAELAKAKGVVAVEVADVYDAYKLLTGKQLPAPLPVAVGDMAVETATTAAVDAKYQGWQSRLSEKSNALSRVTATTGPLAMLVTASKQSAEHAAALRTKGATAAAYAKIVAATIYASAAIDSAGVLEMVKAGNIDGARMAVTGAAQLDGSRALQTISEVKPSTIGGHILMMGAFQTGLRGAGLASLAQYQANAASEYLSTLLDKPKAELASQKVADEVLVAVIPAFISSARSSADGIVAVERLEFEKTTSISYMCSIPNVRQLASAFRSSSTAELSYFDAVLIEPLAQSAGITPDAARMRIAATEPDYLIIYALAHFDQVGDEIKQVLGESSIAWNLMLLAGAERAYVDAAELTAKHYALAEASYKTKADRDTAIAQMLASADLAARRSARSALVATGAIPVQAKIAYELAAAQREKPGFDEKLDALAGYWSAATYSLTAVMLARN